MKRVLVIGLGRFGRTVAETLAEARAEVIALDTDMAAVEAVRDKVAVAAQVDAVEADTLQAVGAVDVDAAVVAIGEDFAAEVLAVAVLRELGIKEIVARAQTDRQRRILELVGATRVVSVEVEMGQRLARALLATQVLDHLPLGNGLSVVYWTADERVLGRTLANSDLRSRWHLVLLAVRSAGLDELNIMPPPEYAFRPGDVLVLAGADARLQAFTR